jgi:hypothetical protein
MQLTFPNGEHASVPVEPGEIAIGSRSNLRLSVPGQGLAPHHASLFSDRRGLWLKVLGDGASVHVNGRPVRHLALLRMGDLVCLEQLRMQVSAPSTPPIETRIPTAAPPALTDAQRLAASRVLLRGVSGSHHGRSYTLTETRVIGRGNGADIRIDDPALAEKHAQVELHGDKVVLRALTNDEGTLLNGMPVHSAVLAPGDQICIDQHRFVLEAPGLPTRGQAAHQRPAQVSHTQTMKAVQVPGAEPPRSRRSQSQESGPQPSEASPSSSSLWWLIAAAALLAAALTALLVYAPRFPGG